jgi:putative hydrolase of the HAD superfamily
MPLRALFGTVDAWVFDLDNTLYPPTANLFAQIDDRMGGFIADFLGLPLAEAKAMQKRYYRTYGTTLRGLMTEHGLDPHVFLDHVHDIDHSVISGNAALAEAIAALPGRKFILTNGTRQHAESVSGRIGITHLFDDVFDIVAAEFSPKPARAPYDAFLRRTGVAPAKAAMFEDLARNLLVPHELGMRTVLVAGAGDHDLRADWDRAGGDADHVDVVTDDLAGFLTDVLEALVI